MFFLKGPKFNEFFLVANFCHFAATFLTEFSFSFFN